MSARAFMCRKSSHRRCGIIVKNPGVFYSFTSWPPWAPWALRGGREGDCLRGISEGTHGAHVNLVEVPRTTSKDWDFRRTLSCPIAEICPDT